MSDNKPANGDHDYSLDHFAQRPAFYVNRSQILANHQVLKHFHPAYEYPNIDVFYDVPDFLPDDIHASVFHQLLG